MFPASGSLLAAPPFPRSGPGEPGSPTSAVLRRRYDFPLTHLPVAYWFASGPHAILLGSCSPLPALPDGRRSRRRPGSLVSRRPPLPARSRVDVSGTSQVPRRSILCLCPAPGPRPDRRALADGGLADAAPAPYENKGSSVTTISRLTTRLRHPLSTLHERCCHRPCKTRFRLAGWPLPGGRRTLWTAMKGFPTSLPPFLGLS